MSQGDEPGTVCAVIPGEYWDDPGLSNDVAVHHAYDDALVTAGRMGGRLAGPPRLVINPYGGDVCLFWPMVKL